jgi:hypothetical protein
MFRLQRSNRHIFYSGDNQGDRLVFGIERRGSALMPSQQVNLISGIWQIRFRNAAVNPTEAAGAYT